MLLEATTERHGGVSEQSRRQLLCRQLRTEFAKSKGMDVVLHEEYAKGSKDFSAILTKVKTASPEVLGISSANLSDFIVFTRQMKEQNINVKMFGTTTAVAEFQKELGKVAEFAYGASPWEPSLPYPGVKEFVDAYQKEFNYAPSLHAAGAYAGCQLFVDALRRADSLDSDKLREALLKVKTQTVLGDFAVDDRGFQVANKAVTIQWQDGQSAVVWPDAAATSKARFPTPPWSQR